MAKKRHAMQDILDVFQNKPVIPAAKVSVRRTGPAGQEREETIVKGSGLLVGPYQFDEFGYYRKSKKVSCSWGFKKPFPKGKTELDIVDDTRAAELGVKPGPLLRLCFEEGKPGAMIPVKTPQEARELAAKFRDCVVGGGNKKKCAVKTAGDPLHLGGYRNPRRSRR